MAGTPYNSIYDSLQQKKQITCCVHGKKCEKAVQNEQEKETDEDNSPYENLYPLKMKDKGEKSRKREKMLCAVVNKLKDLNIEKPKKKKAPRKPYSDLEVPDPFLADSQNEEEPFVARPHFKIPASFQTEDEQEEDHHYDNMDPFPRVEKVKNRREKRKEKESRKSEKRREQRKKDEENEERYGASKRVQRGQTEDEDGQRRSVVKKTQRKKREDERPEESKRVQRKKREEEVDETEGESKRVQKDERMEVEQNLERAHRKREEKSRRKDSRKKEREKKKTKKIRSSRYETRSAREKNIFCFDLIIPNQEDENNRIVHSVYIGCCNYAQAEERVHKKAEFRLYHQLSERIKLDELTEHIPLMLCYKTAHGSYRHYSIRSKRTGERTMYYVDYGDPKVQTHVSLGHLVQFYQINAHVHPDNDSYADPFPWWENDV